MMDFERSPCPIAVTLDVLGDKWTLLVVRDLMLGARRYNDFLMSQENIPTNILADRLKRLEAQDIVEKAAYQKRPPRYEYTLTDKGRALSPVLKKIILWAKAYYPGVHQIKKEDAPFAR